MYLFIYQSSMCLSIIYLFIYPSNLWIYSSISHLPVYELYMYPSNLCIYSSTNHLSVIYLSVSHVSSFLILLNIHTAKKSVLKVVSSCSQILYMSVVHFGIHFGVREEKDCHLIGEAGRGALEWDSREGDLGRGPEQSLISLFPPKFLVGLWREKGRVEGSEKGLVRMLRAGR